MAQQQKSNGKRKVTNNNDKEKENRKTTAYDDIESLQITFYEIESWIEKTTPILTRMTKELDRASGHFDHSKRKKIKELKSREIVDQDKLEQQLVQLQQQQLLWKKSMLCSQQEEEEEEEGKRGQLATHSSVDMQWKLSFQPGNLLRLDTNITSVEQLIDAVQKIRLMQSEEPTVLKEEEDVELNNFCSPTSSTTSQTELNYVEYWFNALKRRPKICLENYKHCRMNLNGLTKNISPQTLNYIGQLCWDCLHPKCTSDWTTFWEIENEDPKRRQACIDSGLALIFLHVIRHDKDACDNAQEIAGFYYDRARDELMEFFDDKPDCSTIETLLNLSMFCITCKRYSQARIYIGLCLHMVIECGIHKLENLPKDLITRKKHLKLLLILYFNDYHLSVFIGEPALIVDTEYNIDFFDVLETNKKLLELDLYDFDNYKTISKETYYVYTVKLGSISKQVQLLINRNSTKKQLISQEKLFTNWLQHLPNSLKMEYHDYNLYDFKVNHRKVLDSNTLDAHAALLLKINYEAQWIILHKAVLTSIRQQKMIEEEENRSNRICSNSADEIVHVAELITKCFGWCVCQQVVYCLYHASTVYCGQALVKNDLELRNKAKENIHRIMRILDAGGANHEGFPDDMTECLCEFLTNHGMHNNNVECSCTVIDHINTTATTIDSIPTLGPLDGIGIIHNSLLQPSPTHKHLKKLRHISSIVLEDSP